MKSQNLLKAATVVAIAAGGLVASPAEAFEYEEGHVCWDGRDKQYIVLEDSMYSFAGCRAFFTDDGLQFSYYASCERDYNSRAHDVCEEDRPTAISMAEWLNSRTQDSNCLQRTSFPESPVYRTVDDDCTWDLT